MTPLILLAAAASAPSCVALDGDTIRCGSLHLRLSGIDSPELPGHCRASRVCVKGDPFAARTSLSRAIAGQVVRYRFITRDRYGRTVALVWAGSTNLSCHQLTSGNAVYVPKWDNGRLVARECARASQ